MTKVLRWLNIIDTDGNGRFDFSDISRIIFLGLTIFMVVYERHDGVQYTNTKFVVVVACAGMVEIVVRVLQAMTSKKNETLH